MRCSIALAALSGVAVFVALAVSPSPARQGAKAVDPKQTATQGTAAGTKSAPAAKSAPTTTAVNVRPGDWNQWGGSPTRNNTPDAKDLPTEWNIGGFDAKTGDWLKEKSKNIKWVAKLGSQSYGNLAVVNGKIFCGTNNGAGYVKRYPPQVDLGCLLCFSEADGKFLWQHSNEKLSTGRVHDWPLQGVCAAPLVEGNRLWYVSNRGEIVCLDTEGFYDDKNDGPYTQEKSTDKDEADVIWIVDMMKQLGISQHNMCACSVTCAGDMLFVTTGNGVDEGHVNIPAPDAPSFVCLDKRDGKVIWTDKSPGLNILHGQWSSPTYGILGGVPQVLFGGGDGWLYSFLAEPSSDGKAKLLWKFDCNPKDAKYVLGGKANRNHLIGTPVIYEGMVYIGVGEDPEHGEGIGHFWCIDPTKRGDVSPELVFNTKDLEHPLPPRRVQNCIAENGEITRPNPISAAVWHFNQYDFNGDGKIDFEETMHRTCGTATIKDGLLVIADFSGFVHCLDAKTGKQYWCHDMLAACWGSAMIADGKIYVGDEDGDIAIFKLSKQKELISEIPMGRAVYTTPVVANGILFISTNDHLFAIQASPAVEK